ncbi:putative membrane protein [Palleronia pelagia]|uniref:Putative membrane protein n=2 Tax=Palleronia pelagia TaxID=387096 RepID=A0A1H8BF50_9RHOB|nr:putative membrane protein [Palleronia pelagia]
MMWGSGHGIFGGLWMILFWGIIIALIVWAVMALRGKGGNGGPDATGRPDALETLRERLAKGEIDEEEFRRRKAALDE